MSTSETPGAARKALFHIRLADDLRQEVKEYAATLGISESAAAAVLLRRGLDAEKGESR